MNPDLEELISKVDMNDNGVEDTKEIKAWYTKAIDWIKASYKTIAIYLTIAILGILIGSATTYKYHPPTVTEKIVYKDNPSDVVLSKNWLNIVLDDMKVTKTRFVKSSITGEELVGVWRSEEKQDGNSIYIAIFEPIKDMKYNNKEYTEHKKSLELEKEKEEK